MLKKICGFLSTILLVLLLALAAALIVPKMMGYQEMAVLSGSMEPTINTKDMVVTHPKDKYEVIEYHGIALDEKERAEKNKEKECIYPLIEYGMTEKDALEYCYSKGLDWNGLYKKLGRVSCWCCPLKSLKELKVIYEEYPQYWKRLKEWDNNTYRQFRSDYSIEDLENKFRK